jgi:hypothetical protein
VADSAAARAAADSAGVAACGPVARVAAGTPGGGGTNQAAGRAAVWRADSLLGLDAGHPARGLAAVLAPDARLVREHRPVAAGAAAADEARRVAGRLRGTPLGAGAAASGDLAYTYGAYTLAGGAGAAEERGHYLRVWRAGPRGWALLLDVTNALPQARAAGPRGPAPAGTSG